KLKDYLVGDGLYDNELKQYMNAVKPLVGGFDLIIDPVVITNPSGHIIYANSGAEKRIGFQKGEMIGKNLESMWENQMTQKLFEKMWDLIRLNKPFVGEVKIEHRDGYTYWQEIRVLPILDEKNKINFYIGYLPSSDTSKNLMDVEHKRKIIELEQLNKIFIDRELKMVELKEEIDKLKLKLNK
ncbi:MAG: PAS domain-containing protein, partial [Nitrospiria bacterium]